MVVVITSHKFYRNPFSIRTKRKMLTLARDIGTTGRVVNHCDIYVGGKVRVLEFMIFLALQHFGSK